MSRKPAKNVKKTAPRRGGKKGKSKTKNVSDYAGCTVVRTLEPAVTNQMYSFDRFILQDYQRAAGIAQYYQRYRITGITVKWKPAYDTYSQATPLQKPNLYYMVDRSGAIPDNITLEALKQMGAKPHAFDERPLVATFKPSVLNEVLNQGGAGSAAGYQISPLLSTNSNATNPGLWNASTIAHQGLKWYMEQAGGNTQINMEVEVQFEFFKPLLPQLAAQPALGLVYAKLDASPDGVEGGTDGITIPL